MKFKSCPAFKISDTSADAGTFEAIVSVFGNVDSVGDVVMPGAFTDTLADWKASGDPIPVLWSHRMDDPRFSIGTVLDAAELEPHDARIPDWADEWLKEHGGLWVKGQLDTSSDASDVAAAARKLLKGRLVKQFSYAYDVVDAGWGTVGGQDAYELRKLQIFEVSPTQIGANNLTQLLGAKAAALVANATDLASDPARRLVSGMDTKELCEAIAYFSKALAERSTGHDTDASGNGTVKGEEPSQVKPEEPARRNELSARLLSQIEILELECAL
jgi:HK97 family phage prohead protease